MHFFGVAHFFLVMTSSSDECPGVCRGGEMSSLVGVKVGLCHVVSIGKLRGSVTLYPGNVEKVKISPPTQPGHKAVLLTHHITSEGFFTSSKGNDTVLVRG